MVRICRVPLLVVFSLLSVSAWGQGNTQRGAAFGGLAGAVAGGIIGENNDEAGAGALIGGVLGAVTGATVGNARDREQQAYVRNQYYQQQQQALQTQQARQQAVSLADVAHMSRSGLSDALIINHIQQRGIQLRLEVSDIITLHGQGVSETVISQMQNATVGTPNASVSAPPRSAPVVVQPAPVIVRERYYRSYPVSPWHDPHHYYHHPRRHHHGGSRIGFSFGF
jgi:hypothetical protein